MRRLILLCLLMMPLTSAWSMGQLTPPAENTSLIGTKAPDVMLPKNTGETASVIGSAQGKKAILMFWATWCPHCHTVLQELNASKAAIEGQGIKVILVDLGESREEVNAYLERKGIAFESFLDEETVLQDPYQIIGVPQLVFIDEQGMIRGVDHGLPSSLNEIFN